MFIPLTKKTSVGPTSTESATNRLASRRSSLVSKRLSSHSVEQSHILQRNIGDQATLAPPARRATSLAGNETDDRNEQRTAQATLSARAPTPGSWDFTRIPTFPPDRASRHRTQSSISTPPLRGIVHPTLAVAEVNGPLEHEADQVAGQVMLMPDPELSIAPAPPQLSRKCEACEEEERNKLQTKRAVVPVGGACDAPPIVHEVLRSDGQPLDAAARAFFEPRFGHDFSQIRVHADNQAALSARSVGALAYASGSHIAFGTGQYAPGTNAGKVLLAHELAHTLQQTGQSETGVVSRRVAGVSCPANQFGAPDDPRVELETADQIAIDQSNQMAQGLAADAESVRGGIPADPSATLQAFEDHFGLPIASGAGFLNRLTGVVRPTQEIALSEELSVVSLRFGGVARLMSQGLSYNCPGNSPLSLVGCAPGTCAGPDAFSCPGNSLVALCAPFWTDFDDTARAQILIHESLHISLGNIGVGSILDVTTRGPGRNFNIAGCYEALIADITGADSHVGCPDVPAA